MIWRFPDEQQNEKISYDAVIHDAQLILIIMFHIKRVKSSGNLGDIRPLSRPYLK